MENGIILTVNLQGVYSSPVSYKSSKKIVSKVKSSPFEKGVWKKGKVHYETPKNHFVAPNNFEERTTQDCCRKTHITGEVINDWVKTCPQWEKAGNWKHLSKKAKIESYIHKFDEGFGVSYEILD